MNKIISVLAVFGILLLPLTALSQLEPGQTGPTLPSQGISVHGKRSGDVMKDMKVKPYDKIFVHRYNRVYWDNNSDTPIRIKFGTGKNCKDISNSPQQTDFWYADKCHITKEPIPPKGRLEIYFNERGTYDYEIQFVGTKSLLKAQLIVQ